MTVYVDRAVSLAGGRAEWLALCAGLHRRPRRLDDLCLAGLAAAGRVLEDERAVDAIVLGTALGCTEADYEWYAQVLEDGLEGANPRLFAYTLPNVVLGEIAIALKLRGENQCITAGRASGLMAVGEAAALVRAGTPRVLALALDVVGSAAERLYAAPPTPAAFAFVLSAEPTPDAVEVGDYRAWFDPEAPGARPTEGDRLAGTGLALPLEGRREVRCDSGHCAGLTFG